MTDHIQGFNHSNEDKSSLFESLGLDEKRLLMVSGLTW